MRLIAEKQIRPTVSAQLQEFRQQMLSTPILQTVSANTSHLLRGDGAN